MEGIARYKPPEEYAKLSQTKCGKLVLACSITRNWIRLKTINSTKEIEKLRHIQGVRFVLYPNCLSISQYLYVCNSRVYNTTLVVLSHTILGFLSVPVANTRYPELVSTIFFLNQAYKLIDLRL